MLRSLPRAGLVLLLTGAAHAAQVTETKVRAAFEEARAAVQEVLGRSLEPMPPLLFAGADDLAECVAAENLPMILLRQPDREKAQQEAERAGAGFAAFAFAKYSWSTKEFLVVLDSWNQQARALDSLELTEDETIRAVLVHELVHALDDAAYGLKACVLRCPTVDVAVGFNAVLEGHAQHVARAVCAKRGWSTGFEAFETQIGALPSGVDEATRQFLRAQSAASTSAYKDGERFVAALEAHDGGAELVARAFLQPPDGETIFHPEWFIDPASRPVARYDPEPALDQFVARFPAETWTATRYSLTPAQVAAGLALLPEETSRKVTATLRNARALALQPTADPNAKMVVLVVLEFDSSGSAEAFLAASRELSHIKDERMKTGVIRILSSSYTELSGESFRGEYYEKRMKNRALEFDVSSIDLQSGQLVLETIFSGEPIERETHVSLVKGLLDSIHER